MDLEREAFQEEAANPSDSLDRPSDRLSTQPTGQVKEPRNLLGLGSPSNEGAVSAMSVQAESSEIEKLTERMRCRLKELENLPTLTMIEEKLTDNLARLTAIEDAAKRATAKNADEDSDDSTTNRRDAHQRKSTPAMNVLTMEQFSKRYEDEDFSHSPESEERTFLEKPHHTIDVVVVGGPSSSQPKPTFTDRSKMAEHEASSAGTVSDLTSGIEFVRFIQINSPALCALLHEHARHDFSNDVVSIPISPGIAGSVAVEPSGGLCEPDLERPDGAKSASTHVTDVSSSAVSSQKLDRTVASTSPRNSENWSAVESSTSKCLVSWRNAAGLLQWSRDKGYMSCMYMIGPGPASLGGWALKLDAITSVQRTNATSPVKALKVVCDNVRYDLLFVDKDQAHADLEAISSTLAAVAKRTELSCMTKDTGSAASSGHSILSPIFADTDVLNFSKHNADAMASAGVTSESRIQLERKALQTAEWAPVDLRSEDPIENKVVLGAEDRTGHGIKAYEDLGCLLEFYDHYVKSHWEALKDKTVSKVRFSDLCLLFRPGERLFVPVDEDQKAWRVLKVTGGRPVLDHLLSNTFSFDGESTADGGDAMKKSKAGSKDDGAVAKQEPQGKRASDFAKWTPLVLDCYYIDFDGSKFAPVHRQFTINFFASTKDVKALRAYPLDWLGKDASGNSSTLLTGIIRDGQRFATLCLTQKQSGDRLFYYDGRTNVRSPSGRVLYKEPMQRADSYNEDMVPATSVMRAEDVSSHVVIDFDKTFQYNPDWKPKFNAPDYARRDHYERATDYRGLKDFIEVNCEWEGSYDWDETDRWNERDEWMQPPLQEQTDNRDLLDKEDYALLPNRAFGYVLRTRSWACLDVHLDRLQAVGADATGWNDLQIPPQHRSTLISLVKRHFDNKAASERLSSSQDYDIIQGKGEYLSGLDEAFKLAQAWDCILLLDEADVFLAQRGVDDLERNALVSVFLRTLEYYSGIMFLTTNRVGSFDEAFRSRIHSALFYRDLNRDQTIAIWQKSLERLITRKERLNQKFELLQEDSQDIVLYAANVWNVYSMYEMSPWNGRQIRNAFQTAVALAEHRAHEAGPGNHVPKLGWEDFRAVILASQDFERYIIRTHGGETDYAMAKRNRLRISDGQQMSGNVASGNVAKDVANAFLHALEQVHPRSIVGPPMPFSNSSAAGPNQRALSRQLTYNEVMSDNTPTQRNSYPSHGGPMAPAGAYGGATPGYSSPSPAPMQQQYQQHAEQNFAYGQQTAQRSVQYQAVSPDQRMSMSGQTYTASNSMAGTNMPGMQQQAFQSAPNMLQQDPFHAPLSQQAQPGAMQQVYTPQPQSQGYNLPGQQQQQVGSPAPPGYQRQQSSHFEQGGPINYQQTHAGMSSPSPAPTQAQAQRAQNVGG
ncbi:hypothetical protein LTR37_015513 [Vermiconidia calcicola]|uniref:Uncharacterized protein n=1 Tax=Vermiconidia calcicola TaxID=1690605 RepID=A0ACC3MS48_9PEZI|nr:hypothetical protein LTR37_015513 [Vermiconidia calcicola]